MGATQNLQGQEANDKIKELIDHNSTCLFATQLTYAPVSVRPMASTKVEEDGTIWFFSKEDSDKNAHIEQDQRVQLLYSNQSAAEFLSLYGYAEIVTDRNKIDELWTPIAKAWFTEGKDDPSVTLIKVTPEEGYYWDTKNNKVISLAKIAISALSGKTNDNGVEGEIKR